MKKAWAFWRTVAGCAALSGAVFLTYMFFSGGMCQAALEFAEACTLQTRAQALRTNWQSALLFLPVALAIGAILGMRLAARARQETQS